MHVHVHQLRRQLQKQHEGRVALMMQYVLIGLAQRVAGDLVAHEAAVDEKVLSIAAGARIGGQGGQALQREVGCIARYLHRGLAELVT